MTTRTRSISDGCSMVTSQRRGRVELNMIRIRLRLPDLSTVARMTLPVVPLGDFDLSDVAFWLAPRDYRDGAFKTLRDEPGLVFFKEAVIEDSPFPPGPGYYALSRHEDIWHVSRNAQLFCSSKGSNIGDLPQEMNEFFGSMINMDDPKHFRLRSIVSKGFTPKEVGRVEDNVRVKAAEIVDRLLE